MAFLSAFVNVFQETINYSRDINSLTVNWGGFEDVHSGIMFYRFCVGSQSGECDVRTWEETGLHTGILLQGFSTTPTGFVN